MKTTAAPALALACAVLGFWLPSLWLASPPAVKSRIAPVQTALPPAMEPGWQDRVRHARSPMAMFQAVAAGVEAHGPGFILHSGRHGEDLELGSEEAEALARALAVDALGQQATDATTFFKSLPELKEFGLRYGAIRAWVKAHPEAALAALAGPEHAGLEDSDFSDLALGLALWDPDKAADLLRTMPFSHNLTGAWLEICKASAKKGPEAALAAIKAVPAVAGKLCVRVTLIELATADPRSALAWHEALPPEYREEVSTHVVYERWARTDPGEAFHHWRATDISTKSSTGFTLANAWARQEPDAALQWARSHRESEGQLMEAVTRNTARSDPSHALELLPLLPPGTQDSLMPGIGKSWALIDAPAAFEWARTLPPDKRDEVMAAMLPQVDHLPAVERRAFALEAAGTAEGIRVLLDTDPAEAEKALAALPPDKARTIRMELSGRLVETSPAIAGRFVADLLNSPPGERSEPDADSSDNELVRVAANFTAAWAARDPAATAAWVQTLPANDPASQAATANLVHTWMRYDPSAARQWVDSLPEGEVRTKAEEAAR